MACTIYQDILKKDIRSLISESEAIEDIEHNPIKGSIREQGLGELLLKYLPFGWDIGSGKIIDFNGQKSNETDLIIYHKALLPPIMFGSSLGLFPIESCKYVIEVKTTSNSSQIKSTIQKFKNLNELQYIQAKDGTTYGLVKMYFAFSSDLKEANEFDRYKKYDKDWERNPIIQVICVVGKGYWFFSQEHQWKFMNSDESHFEIAKLIGGIINTLNGDSIPSFGMYLMD